MKFSKLMFVFLITNFSLYSMQEHVEIKIEEKEEDYIGIEIDREKGHNLELNSEEKEMLESLPDLKQEESKRNCDKKLLLKTAIKKAKKMVLDIPIVVHVGLRNVWATRPTSILCILAGILIYSDLCKH